MALVIFATVSFIAVWAHSWPKFHFWRDYYGLTTKMITKWSLSDRSQFVPFVINIRAQGDNRWDRFILCCDARRRRRQTWYFQQKKIAGAWPRLDVPSVSKKVWSNYENNIIWQYQPLGVGRILAWICWNEEMASRSPFSLELRFIRPCVWSSCQASLTQKIFSSIFARSRTAPPSEGVSSEWTAQFRFRSGSSCGTGILLHLSKSAGPACLHRRTGSNAFERDSSCLQPVVVRLKIRCSLRESSTRD